MRGRSFGGDFTGMIFHHRTGSGITARGWWSPVVTNYL
jgi:hypothetical protein